MTTKQSKRFMALAVAALSLACAFGDGPRRMIGTASGTAGVLSTAITWAAEDGGTGFHVGSSALFHSGPPPLRSFLISKLSLKAWMRVESWPEPRTTYSRSMPSVGMPYSSRSTWTVSVRS